MPAADFRYTFLLFGVQLFNLVVFVFGANLGKDAQPDFFNMRLVLHVGTKLWAEQGHKAKRKLTAQQDLEHSVAAALGAGEAYLRGMWRDAVTNAARFNVCDLEGYGH